MLPQHGAYGPLGLLFAADCLANTLNVTNQSNNDLGATAGEETPWPLPVFQQTSDASLPPRREVTLSNGTTSISSAAWRRSCRSSSLKRVTPIAALLSTIALFTAGFLVRPLGAFVFGWLGDMVGRKYTFILTLVGMALGTGAIGLIPTFDQIGLSAAIILFLLRMLQGLCLGGSYGGAITYVAEHVPEDKRGYYTGWLQTSPTLGIVLSLIIIIVTRTYFGEAVFTDWAWRIPFLCSFPLVFVTMYMRANFESRRSMRRSRPRVRPARTPGAKPSSIPTISSTW